MKEIYFYLHSFFVQGWQNSFSWRASLSWLQSTGQNY